MSLTGIILIIVTVALLLYNQFKGERPTISRTWADAAARSLVLPFIWGMWTAHLAAPHNNPQSHPIIFLAAIVTVLLLDLFIFDKRRDGYRWPILWVLIGMPVGYFCWASGF